MSTAVIPVVGLGAVAKMLLDLGVERAGAQLALALLQAAARA